MPTTVTSTAVAAVVANGAHLMSYVPGRIMCSYASKTTFAATETISAGLVLQMVPVPSGARILGVTVAMGIPLDAAAGVFSVGDGSLTNRFITGASISTSIVARMTQGLGYKYSLSDGVVAPLRFDTIDVNFGAVSQTTTGSLIMQVYWVVEATDA